MRVLVRVLVQSAVIATLACPSRSEITFKGTPAIIRMVAGVCRIPWSVWGVM